MDVFVFKRVVFTDEWIAPCGSSFSERVRKWAPISWILSPRPRKSVEFPSYILGYRLEATPRELTLIQRHKMFGHAVVTVHAGDPPLTFADLLGPELVPEVSPYIDQLLRVEGLIREAAAMWSLFFQSMDEPKAD